MLSRGERQARERPGRRSWNIICSRQTGGMGGTPSGSDCDAGERKHQRAPPLKDLGSSVAARTSTIQKTRDPGHVSGMVLHSRASSEALLL